MSYRVDLAALPPDFKVTRRGTGDNRRVLIVPDKSKHLWAPNELHLRSLLTDVDGYVLSAGFPKFFNFGEDAATDAGFIGAMGSMNRVRLTEKFDGTLVIVDVSTPDRSVTYRTRGNFDLGDFEERLTSLIVRNYNALPSVLLGLDWAQQFSFLFEYTGPENQVVLRYHKAELTFLGVVDKTSLNFLHSDAAATMLMKHASVWNPPELRNWLGGAGDLKEEVSGWTGREGLVGYWETRPSSSRVVGHLVKLKTAEYVRLHALRFHMSGRKAAKLACVLDITTPSDIVPKLATIGVDAETAEFARTQLDEASYFDRLREFTRESEANRMWFGATCANYKLLDASSREGYTGKKGFVFDIDRLLNPAPLSDSLRAALRAIALMMWDEKPETMLEQVKWSWVLEEPMPEVRKLLANRRASIDAMLRVPVPDDA